MKEPDFSVPPSVYNLSRVNHRRSGLARTNINITFACLESAYTGKFHRDPDPVPPGVRNCAQTRPRAARSRYFSRKCKRTATRRESEGSWNCRGFSSKSRAIDHTHRGSVQFAHRTYKARLAGARTHLLHMHGRISITRVEHG